MTTSPELRGTRCYVAWRATPTGPLFLLRSNVFLKGKSSPTTLVREAMDRGVVVVGCDEATRDCMAIMTGKRTRPLLVMKRGEFLGILSIVDLVRSIVAEQELTIGQLEQYNHRG